jgi:hypothetical protein
MKGKKIGVKNKLKKRTNFCKQNAFSSRFGKAGVQMKLNLTEKPRHQLKTTHNLA